MVAMTTTAYAECAAWIEERGLPTPCLLFRPRQVQAAVDTLRREVPAKISYAFKANRSDPMFQTVDPLVDLYNVTNVVDALELVRRGVEPHRVLFVNPVATAADLRALRQHGISQFVVDDCRGARLLAEVVGGDLDVTIRLTPPDPGGSERSVVRFGCVPEDVVEIAEAVREGGSRVTSLSFFAGVSGSGMERALPYSGGLATLAEAAERLSGAGIDITVFNMGGGLPGANRRFYRDHPEFYELLRAAIARWTPETVSVILEPGRFLSEPAMCLVTRVVADRTRAGQRFVHLDVSGYNGLFESTFISVGGEDLHPVWAAESANSTEATVVGPIMDSFDVLIRRRAVPPLKPSDLVLVPDVGAYCNSYTTSAEGRTEPPIVTVPDELESSLLTCCGTEL